MAALDGTNYLSFSLTLAYTSQGATRCSKSNIGKIDIGVGGYLLMKLPASVHHLRMITCDWSQTQSQQDRA